MTCSGKICWWTGTCFAAVNAASPALAAARVASRHASSRSARNHRLHRRHSGGGHIASMEMDKQQG